MIRLVVVGCILLAVGSGCGSAPPQPYPALHVQRTRWEGAEWIVAEADARHVRLRMLSHGPHLRSLRDAESLLERRGERLLLATNGGLFHGETPVGLQVEGGRLVNPLRLGGTPPAGQNPGNFYDLPNAVLYQDHDGTLRIVDSAAMEGREHEIRDGLQSGPALLLNGEVHAIALPPNRGRPHGKRSAACIAPPGTLHVVYAVDPTTFPQLARFLADGLGCRDAVFLDANVTGLYIPSAGVHVPAEQFAGILALTVPVAAEGARP